LEVFDDFCGDDIGIERVGADFEASSDLRLFAV
jgi:hypothetical protein